ncbi:uncharacterized protein [Antedon mediterranea]|uniref:uncharacterized protein n=1 Tax=Antedon mediterranea TaxID=105859 RepID=UPI003AF8AADD
MAAKLHLIEEFLECSVCLKNYSNPRVLHCLHSFCKDCLTKHIEPMRSRIACPKCDFKTVLDKDGLAALKVNSLILNLQNFNKIHQLIKNPSEPIVCTLCDSREVATGRCFECDEFLCAKCVESHQRIKMFQEHVVNSLEELKTTSLRTLYKKSRKVSKCPRHEEENQRYFCQSCDVTICRECTVVDHPRPVHNYVDVRDAASKCRNKVIDKMNDLKKKKGCFHDAIDEIQTIENSISQKASKMKSDVVSSSEEKIKLIKQEEAKQLTRIESQVDKKFGKIENKKSLIENKLKFLQTNVDFLNEILNLGSDRDVVSIRTEIESTASRLFTDCKIDDNLKLPKDVGVLSSDKPKPAPRPRLEKKGSGLNRSGSSSRGDSFFTTSLSCISKFGKQGTGLKEFGYARRAAVTKHGDIVITDTNNCKVQMYTATGELKLTINVAKEPLNAKQGPLDVAITPDGRILIVQEECTDMTSYNMKGNLLNKLAFVASNESTGPCLAVGRDGRVAIGNWQNDTLRFYYADGSLIWKITCPSPWSIAINSKHQLAVAFNVSLHTQSKVKLINEDGQDIHEVTIPSTKTENTDMDLTGICFDKHDNLYILDWTMKVVHMLNNSADGTYQYVMCVITGLEYPLGITCTNDDKMVVVEKHFVSVFSRKDSP